MLNPTAVRLTKVGSQRRVACFSSDRPEAALRSSIVKSTRRTEIVQRNTREEEFTQSHGRSLDENGKQEMGRVL